MASLKVACVVAVMCIWLWRVHPWHRLRSCAGRSRRPSLLARCPRLPSERWTTVGGVAANGEEPELSREDHRRPPGCVQLPEASCGCHFWLQCQQRGCTSWQMWRQHPLQDQHHLHQLRQDEVMNRGSCKEEMEGKIFNLVIL
ncbi:hypothetical protein E2542_SST30048 [Spatholobus suberectus]|nr:hypothetical protein E2542_SST30048 [Spatholobus suberectus]